MILVALSASAAADDTDTPKSPTAAFVLSAGATAVSYGVLGLMVATDHLDSRGDAVAFAFAGTGALLGPSLGQVYVDHKRTSPALYLRLGALPMFLIGGFVVAAECEEADDCTHYPKGKFIYGTAAAMIVAGTAWELIAIRGEARRYNRAWRRAPVTLVPQLGRSDVGLALAGQF